MQNGNIPELEYVLKEKVDGDLKERISGGYSYYSSWWVCTTIENALTDLLNTTEKIVPFTADAVEEIPQIQLNVGERGVRYVVKAKNTSTKLLTVTIIFETGTNSQNLLSVKEIIVTPITHLISDYDTFVSYSEERVKKMIDKLDRKSADFKANLTACGLSVKDYFMLMNEFNRLDAPTRRRLYQESRD